MLPSATQDTGIVLGVVQQLLRGMLRKDCAYKRAGVVLMDLARPEDLQADLFRPAMIGDPALMSTIDKINRRFGSGKIAPAATAQPVRPQWAMRQQRLSPCFTTRLSDLPRATC